MRHAPPPFVRHTFFIAVALLALLLALDWYKNKDGKISRPPVSVVYAATSPGSGELTGYAWSSQIGWISFTPADSAGQKVSVALSGELSGYAWNPALGWLSFNRSDAGVPPNPPNEPHNCSGVPATANACIDYGPATPKLKGWARFIAACTNNDCDNGLKDSSDPWDGWVRLSDDSPYAYGPELNGVNEFAGAAPYAWGAHRAGWILFTNASPVYKTTFTVTTPAFTPPAGSAGSTVAKVTFITDRPETSTKGNFSITAGGATSFTIGAPTIVGQSQFTVAATRVDATTGATLSSTFSTGGTHTVTLRLSKTSGTVPVSGTYTVNVPISYSGTQSGSINIPISLQITNAIASSTER